MSYPSALLPLPPHFSFRECLWFLDRNYDDCLHQIHDGKITKLVTINREPVLLQVSETEGNLLVELPAGRPDQLPEAEKYVLDWLDMDRDLEQFYRLLADDPQLSFLQEQYRGLRLIGIPDLFEAICWCIIGQQINLRFAYSLKRRLVERYGDRQVYQGDSFYLFPAPVQLLAVEPDDLRNMQFSGRKIEYLLHVAGLFASGALSKAGFAEHTPDEMLNRLTAIRGIGDWTAHYALMKSLRSMTNIPYGDAGLNKALHLLKGTDKKPSRKVVDDLFAPYNGWQSYLVIYLWRTLSTG